MPGEIIGEVGTPGAEAEWIEAQEKTRDPTPEKVCRDPPSEMELDLVWQDNELASYPVVVLAWDNDMRGAPWNVGVFVFGTNGRPVQRKPSAPLAPLHILRDKSAGEPQCSRVSAIYQQNRFNGLSKPSKPPGDGEKTALGRT